MTVPSPSFPNTTMRSNVLKELGESGIQRPLSNKKRGHPFLIDGEDFLGIESLFHQLQNSRISHHDRFGMRKGLTNGFKSRQSENKIAQGALMNRSGRIGPPDTFRGGWEGSWLIFLSVGRFFPTAFECVHHQV